LKSTTGKRNAHLHKYTQETLEVVKRDNCEMLRFYGYADEPGENSVNAFNLDEEYCKTMKPKRNGYKEHNKQAIKQVIEISKDSSLIKTHQNYGCEALRMPPTARLTDVCVEEARIRMKLKKKCYCQFTFEFDNLLLTLVKFVSLVAIVFLVITFGIKITVNAVEQEF